MRVIEGRGTYEDFRKAAGGEAELSPARFSFLTLHFRHPRWLWLLFVPGEALGQRGLLRGCPMEGQVVVDVVGVLTLPPSLPPSPPTLVTLFAHPHSLAA